MDPIQVFCALFSQLLKLSGSWQVSHISMDLHTTRLSELEIWLRYSRIHRWVRSSEVHSLSIFFIRVGTTRTDSQLKKVITPEDHFTVERFHTQPATSLQQPAFPSPSQVHRRLAIYTVETEHLFLRVIHLHCLLYQRYVKSEIVDSFLETFLNH